MRLLYLPLLFLSTDCFAQQTTSYVVESRTEQNNETLNFLNTYLSIQTPEPHTKKAFPYHMTIHNVVFNNPKMPFSFSSLEPEKNKNIGSSSLLLNNIYLINRSFPFAIRDNELIIDSLTIQNEIGSQMKAWEIKEDIAQNAEKNIY